MENNCVDVTKTIRCDNTFGTLKEPSPKPKDWPLGAVLAEDGESPANCFIVKDGIRKEIESALLQLKKLDKGEKKLVFIVAAGHGVLDCAT